MRLALPGILAHLACAPVALTDDCASAEERVRAAQPALDELDTGGVHAGLTLGVRL